MKKPKEILICSNCNMPIDTTSHYLEICHYKNKETLLIKQPVHIRCFQEKINASIVMSKLAQDVSGLVVAMQERVV